MFRHFLVREASLTYHHNRFVIRRRQFKTKRHNFCYNSKVKKIIIGGGPSRGCELKVSFLFINRVSLNFMVSLGGEGVMYPDANYIRLW